MYIYRLYNKNKEIIYIGKTKNNPKLRIRTHFSSYSKYTKDDLWRIKVRYYDYIKLSRIDTDMYEIYLINKFNNLFIIRSFTKIFAIPGIRLGYGIGNEELIKNMEANRDPWSVNIFAQLIGEKIITLKQYYQKSRSKLFLEKDILYNLLTQINGIKPTYPEANFILINLSRSGKTSTEVTRQLAKKGIIVRNCNTFKNLRENYIRVAVGERSANMKLIKGLKEIILG
jgi:threonine-phosphate decarboxylase